jgi:hypothetical protein
MADSFHEEAQQTVDVTPDPNPEHDADKDTWELEDAPAKKPKLIHCVWEQIGQWTRESNNRGQLFYQEWARTKSIEVASKGDGEVNMRDVK